MKIYFYTSSKERTYDRQANKWSSGSSVTHYILQTAEFVPGIVFTAKSPDDGIVFYISNDPPSRKKGVIYVSIRIDKKEHILSDFEIVNAPVQESERCLMAYPWPMPSLQVRDASRGLELKTVGFNGTAINLHKSFLKETWFNYLKDRGLAWILNLKSSEWNNYKNIDISIAIRPDNHITFTDRGLENKPPTKLFNVWHAGSIPIFGNDYGAYSFGREGVDYLKAVNADEASVQIDSLLADTAKVSSILKAIELKKREFSFEAVRDRWLWLFNQIEERQKSRESVKVRTQQFANFLNRYDTDKATRHSYDLVYGDLLPQLKDSAKNVLELGIGGSLLAWRDYFQNAEIVGIDTNAKKLITGEKRITTLCLDACSMNVLSYSKKRNIKYDLIIDDASHSIGEQLISLFLLFNELKSGGFYVIEDVQNLDMFKQFCSIPIFKTFDLRYVKGRYDDLMVVFEKP